MSTLISMLMLYAGKVSGLLVVFLFLPFYNKLLGAEQFGAVAVILSFQALSVMMDFGLSTMIGRAVSLGEGGEARLLHTADMALAMVYGSLALGAVVLKLVGFFSGISWFAIIGTFFLVFFMVLQNIYYSAIIACRKYVLGSVVQVVGGLIRAVGTAVALQYISATLEVFVATQFFFSGIQAIISRLLCMKNLNADKIAKSPGFLEAITLIRSGSSLILFSIAGAAVTQLDKPLVSIFLSAAAVTPYYLANLLCSTPVSILAGPVSQYFQPLFFRSASASASEKIETKKIVRNFVFCIFVVTVIPAFCLWYLRTPIIELWVGKTEDSLLISRYVGILLPGLTIGALGFVPYCFLVFAKDFKFQALMSASMTVLTLSLTVLASMRESVEGVCIIYALYHTVSTVGSWIRATNLLDIKIYAIYSARIMSLLVFLLLSLLWLMAYLIP
ncbi:lipopolysaccharide biosynthesis protein [Pseudomonas gingeri]